MLSEVIGLAKASWQSLNMEIGENLSERQKRQIRHDVARRLVERRLLRRKRASALQKALVSEVTGTVAMMEMVLEMLQIVSVWTVIPRQKI